MAHHEQRRFDGDYHGEYYSLAFEIAITLAHCDINVDFLSDGLKDHIAKLNATSNRVEGFRTMYDPDPTTQATIKAIYYRKGSKDV
ncbi:hypothetical protein D3C79_972710 [compost metagenome]